MQVPTRCFTAFLVTQERATKIDKNHLANFIFIPHSPFCNVRSRFCTIFVRLLVAPFAVHVVIISMISFKPLTWRYSLDISYHLSVHSSAHFFCDIHGACCYSFCRAFQAANNCTVRVADGPTFCLVLKTLSATSTLKRIPIFWYNKLYINEDKTWWKESFCYKCDYSAR